MDRTTAKRSFRLAAAVSAVLLFACGLAGAREWWLSLSPPPREPDFCGRVIEATGQRYLLESPQDGRYWVWLETSTRVQTSNGEPGQLRTGQQVRVWSSGPVMLTYPPQGHAVWIVIESDEPRANEQ